MAEPNKEALCSSGLCATSKTLSLLYAFTKAGEIITTHLSFTGQNYFGKKSMLQNTLQELTAYSEKCRFSKPVGTYTAMPGCGTE